MLGATLPVDQYVHRLQDELARVDQKEIQLWADLVHEAYENEKFVFIFGNGGSGTTASHFAEDLAKSLILIAPAPRSGILPAIDSEKQLDRDMMSLGAFWNTVINPDFDLAKVLTLNCVPEAEQRIVFDKFGPESGLAFFQMFFWMFDKTNATAVDIKRVRCPVLCLVGKDDKMVSSASARATASAYPGSTFWQLDDHGHMLVLEPGAEDIARRIASWIPS